MTLLILNIRLNNGHESQWPDDPKPDQFVLVLWWSVIVVCTDETMVINVFCGVVSGVMSSCLANPTDVLKVNLTTSGALSSFSEGNIPEQVKSVCVYHVPDQDAGSGQLAPRQHDVQLHQHLPDRRDQGAVESKSCCLRKNLKLSCLQQPQGGGVSPFLTPFSLYYNIYILCSVYYNSLL